MKILIVGFTKLKYMPYKNFYLDNIDHKVNDIHLLYWNRDCKQEDLSQYNSLTLHEFLCYQEDEVPKKFKLHSFLKYRTYVKSVIQKNNYDFIIILHTLPGILIIDDLLKRYSGKYILDYRDSTYEEFLLFKKMVHLMVRNSSVTFVSSDAFRKYLPSDKRIYTSHNILIDSLHHREDKDKKGIPSEKIRMAFWGFIRHEEINKKIIAQVTKDKRFELHYYGREQETALNLKRYAKEIMADNVYFHGEYKPEDRYEFINNTDVIHNIYNDNNMMLAMGNKFYDGIIFRLPQLCMKGSFMGERVEKFQVGLMCDPREEFFLENVYKYYSNLDRNAFNNNCDIALDSVLKEYQYGVNIVKNIGKNV